MNWRLLEPRTLIAAMINGSVVVVPGALLGVAVDRDSWLNLLSLAIIFFGFFFTGYVAARYATQLPLTHGSLAPMTLAAVVQAIGVVRRLIVDESIPIVGIALLLMIASSVGMLGALFNNSRAAQYRQAKQSRRASE